LPRAIPERASLAGRARARGRDEYDCRRGEYRRPPADMSKPGAATRVTTVAHPPAPIAFDTDRAGV